MKDRNITFTTSLLVLACCTLLQLARATPPPKPEDRGNGNSAAENVQALNLGTTGSDNTAHGWFSLFSNTTGSSNTANGFQALYNNTEGGDNAAYGFQAMYTNTGSFDREAGSFNTAVGCQALYSNTADIFHRGEASYNTAIGYQALYSNTFGDMFQSGSLNTAVGYQALFSNLTGSSNTAIGYQALYNNTGETLGFENTAVGYLALVNNTIGADNTAIGFDALGNNTTGVGNTALGHQAGLSVTTASNVICIGSIGAANVDNSCFIGNIRGTTTSNFDAIPVLIDSAGQLGTASSSRRFKHDVKPMDNTSESVLALKPVMFHYRSDNTKTPQFGLIAEEVAEVNPDLVVRDENGEIYTVRYDAVNVMLLNEFLKEHKKVEEQQATIGQLKSNAARQQATISELQKDMGVLTAQLEEQAAQIQKVSTRTEMGSPAPKVVMNQP
jgi:hypothetical protein